VASFDLRAASESRGNFRRRAAKDQHRSDDDGQNKTPTDGRGRGSLGGLGSGYLGTNPRIDSSTAA